jgi:hypothetical protein
MHDHARQHTPTESGGFVNAFVNDIVKNFEVNPRRQSFMYHEEMLLIRRKQTGVPWLQFPTGGCVVLIRLGAG